MPRYDFKCGICLNEFEAFVPYDKQKLQCERRECCGIAQKATKIYSTNWSMSGNTGAQKEG